MKRSVRGKKRGGDSRPFTGAWIETRKTAAKLHASPGRPFTGAWIETNPIWPALCPFLSPLHGGVD